jgi:hypothetical protein
MDNDTGTDLSCCALMSLVNVVHIQLSMYSSVLACKLACFIKVSARDWISATAKH